MKAVRTLFRILLGIVFVFSGLVKGMDPLGTVFRMQDYFVAFDTTWANPLALTLTILLCTIEFVLGISLLFNLYIRVSAWILLPMMTFFTILTFFDAAYNMVPDCGCFGDVVKLTNTQTFLKNLVLMVFVIPVFLWRRKYEPALHRRIECVVLLFFTILFGGMSVYSYNHLPFLDTMDWKVGNQINKSGNQEVKFFVTYKNKATGEEQEFLAPDYPWNDSVWMSEWVFVNQRVVDMNQNMLSLRIEDTVGNNVTFEYLSIPEKHFFLVGYDLNSLNIKALQEFIPTVDSLLENGYSCIFLTSALPEDIRKFQLENGITIEFFNADDIILKMMVRANPGLILLKDGVVMAKWHHNDFPTYATLKNSYLLD